MIYLYKLGFGLEPRTFIDQFYLFGLSGSSLLSTSSALDAKSVHPPVALCAKQRLPRGPPLALCAKQHAPSKSVDPQRASACGALRTLPLEVCIERDMLDDRPQFQNTYFYL